MVGPSGPLWGDAFLSFLSILCGILDSQMLFAGLSPVRNPASYMFPHVRCSRSIHEKYPKCAFMYGFNQEIRMPLIYIFACKGNFSLCGVQEVGCSCPQNTNFTPCWGVRAFFLAAKSYFLALIFFFRIF